ncbi:hypothetical protein BJX66DRAFT_260781 [Aspergillus keveii]|uniref:Uncharacterized protein n=1 Tax=Aspergillus keveii TaxID=714993 RepID=A0ABR4GKD2_9EURO
MRPYLVLGTLATILALGGSLPPKDKDKDKGDDYDHDQDHEHDNGHGNDYGSDHDHADSKPDSKPDSKSGFHIADYNPLYLLFTRQPSPGCDDYSAGLCGCFCHYQGYPYYICAKDHCQCYGAYVTGCWYAYYYYIGGGYPAPGDWHQPRYPHCPRYPYCMCMNLRRHMSRDRRVFILLRLRIHRRRVSTHHPRRIHPRRANTPRLPHISRRVSTPRPPRTSLPANTTLQPSTLRPPSRVPRYRALDDNSESQWTCGVKQNGVFAS